MKKALIVIFFIALVMPGLAMAKSNTAYKPGSFAYFLDRGIEKFTLFFVINENDRQEKISAIRAEILAEEGISMEDPQKPNDPIFQVKEEVKLIPPQSVRPSTMPVTVSKPVIDVDLENMTGTITLPSGEVVSVSRPEVKPIAPVIAPTKPISTKPTQVTKPVDTVVVSTDKPSTDLTPRINYWWGKVNQHIDVKSGMWMTDPDGVSGANIDMLTYCKKWYPETRSVREYKYETIKNWKNRGNVSNFESKRMSYECSQKSSETSTDSNDKPDTDTTKPTSTGKIDNEMQIMYWWGKVNQHMDKGDWETDPDGTSGADIDMLKYCKKWYPNSVGVKENKLITTDGWKNRGNLSEFTSTKMAYFCLQK